MKVLVTVLTLLSVASAVTELSFLQHRRLDQNNNNNFQHSWMANYSVKFLGCHHIKQWNDAANDNADVRIETKRLVRFRLCPSQTCSASKSLGCSSGYGDYVMDMDSFMQAYSQIRGQEIEYECQKYQNQCQCNGDEQCLNECLTKAGHEECLQNNNQGFQLENYMYCNRLNVQNGNNNNNNNDNNNGNHYYVGPFCANQGGAIHLGLFTDDTCSNFAEASFESIMGFTLPYSKESIIHSDCLSCHEKNYQDAQAADAYYYVNDQADADQVRESCELLYENSGKCEANLASIVSSPNNNACNYLEGIRMVRQDGIINTASSRPSAVATAFIVLFAMAFAAMAFYVWYLRTRLGLKQNAFL
ncbi:hypothetical protein FisN_29Lh085 [Fistulifera solaris]|uniref:Folate receptor-like domain-containing protein n=1 Tax=Fistulifera solaris TaxID=1519565 RepID=A0A1Z5JLI1_FISSO|nr:hypothetical protein FisN_29Lh085 [Fistulifera solaris]|eukprot:GAX14873.1 hypothetical protein FisN_29Lh085 [Fistulifera solaris]